MIMGTGSRLRGCESKQWLVTEARLKRKPSSENVWTQRPGQLGTVYWSYHRLMAPWDGAQFSEMHGLRTLVKSAQV